MFVTEDNKDNIQSVVVFVFFDKESFMVCRNALATKLYVDGEILNS